MTFTVRIARIRAVGSAGVDIVEAQVLDGFAVLGQTAVVRTHGLNDRLQIVGIGVERSDQSMLKLCFAHPSNLAVGDILSS